MVAWTLPDVPTLPTVAPQTLTRSESSSELASPINIITISFPPGPPFALSSLPFPFLNSLVLAQVQIQVFQF